MIFAVTVNVVIDSKDKAASGTLRTDALGRLAAAEQRWQALLRQGWSPARLEAFTEDVAELLRQLRTLPVPALSELSGQLDEQLRAFQTRPGAAEPRQRAQLTVTLTKLRLALLDLQTSAVARRRRDALGSGDGDLPRLAARSAFGQHGQRLRALAGRLTSAGWRTRLLASPEAVIDGQRALLVDLSDAEADAAQTLLRELKQRHPSTPLIVLADDDGLDARLAAVRAGSDGYFSHPVDVEALLEQLLRNAAASPRPGRCAVAIASENAVLAGELVGELAARSVAARAIGLDDGLLATLLETEPDLLLLDVDMQAFAPLELVGLLRQHERLAQLHLITLCEDETVNQQLSALGPDGIEVLRKPVARDRLLAFISYRLRRLRVQNARLQRLYGKEPLSGLYHRGHFFQRLSRALRPGPERGLVAVLLARLYGVDELNEGGGWQAFDELMQQAGRRLRTLADADPQAARVDDSGIALLLTDASHERLMRSAENVRKALQSEVYRLGGYPQPVRASCGVGVCSAADEGALALLARARRAADQACANGRGVHLSRGYVDAATDAAVATTGRARMYVERLREALTAQRFRLVFQPIVGLRSNPVERYEALLRVYAENGEELSTAALFDYVRQQKVSTTIDRWVIGRALNSLRLRREQSERDTALFINLSPLTLDDETLTAWLRRRLEQTGVAASSLVFEISATDAEHAPDQVARFMTNIRALGCGCTLERCGRGGDDLIDIGKRLPLNYVKLDPTLLDGAIGNAARNRQRRDALKALIEQLDEAGIDVIVAGVEDARSLALLWSLGVSYVQGYFLQRPHGDMLYDFASSA